ncbi:MAG: helix-turn-helix domain-containing protein, partial [Candidatus Sulfobium sp.]
MLSSLRRFTRSEVAQERLRIIKFYREYGEKATKEAFGADRKVVNRWMQRLSQHDGALEGLVPESTRPRRTRTMTVSVEIVQFIREIKREHPRLGKEKIKPLLDEYCQGKGLKSISESTIGKVIKRNKLFYQRAGRIYHDPSIKRPLHQKRLRIKRSPRHEDFGHIIADTVERVTDGVKDYFYNAIDAKLKFALTLNYKRLNSKNMKDFYERFRALYPLQIKDWQSDNGSENLGEFDKALKDAKIPHLFIYPRCPKINSIIERYNRTLQEEFIDSHLAIIHDKELFHQHLADYMLFYLTKRIHKSLDKMTPVDYLIQKGGMSHLY